MAYVLLLLMGWLPQLVDRNYTSGPISVQVRVIHKLMG
jgi:hypothetical protein